MFPIRCFKSSRLVAKQRIAMISEATVMLNPSLLTQPLKPKDRGVLIYLQLMALPNMNDIAETRIEDIANRLQISRQTTSKYIKMFLEKNYLTKGDCSYKCHYLANNEIPIRPEHNNLPIIIL